MKTTVMWCGSLKILDSDHNASIYMNILLSLTKRSIAGKLPKASWAVRKNSTPSLQYKQVLQQEYRWSNVLANLSWNPTASVPNWKYRAPIKMAKNITVTYYKEYTYYTCYMYSSSYWSVGSMFCVARCTSWHSNASANMQLSAFSLTEPPTHQLSLQ